MARYVLSTPFRWMARTVACACFLLVLASAVHSAPRTTIEAIKERGYLVVAMTTGPYYPFYFEDEDGQLRGADVDLAEGVAKALGVDVVFNRESETFDGVVELVARGEADVGVSTLSVTLPRAEKVLYTRPYVTFKQALLINRVRLAATRREMDDPVAFINEIGAEVGSLAGTSYGSFTPALFPEAKIVLMSDWPSLYEAVERGDLFAIHFDENEIRRFIAEDPSRLITLRLEILPEHEDYIAMAVSPDNVHLMEWLNTYLRVHQVDWTLDDVLARYPRPGS